MFKFLILPFFPTYTYSTCSLSQICEEVYSFCQSSIFPVVQTTNLGVILNAARTSTSKPSPSSAVQPRLTTPLRSQSLLICFSPSVFGPYILLSTQNMTLYKHTSMMSLLCSKFSVVPYFSLGKSWSFYLDLERAPCDLATLLLLKSHIALLFP